VSAETAPRQRASFHPGEPDRDLHLSTLVDDGFRGQIEDPFSAPVVTTARFRPSHESSSVPGNLQTSAGLGTNLSLYVRMDYLVPLREGDVFNAKERSWRVGPVNAFKIDGRVYRTKAPLTPADAAP